MWYIQGHGFEMKKVGDFDSMAEEYFTKKRANMKQIRTLENLRNLLLPKLMSGKVRMEHITHDR